MPTKTETPDVGYIRRELVALQPRYDIVRDCVAGQEQVKAAGTKYLPKPNEADASPENTVRYRQYKERALFLNVTGRTLEGMVGSVFQKHPEQELPSQLAALAGDVDGGGVSLEQQAKRGLEYVLQFGRAGLLADYPATAGPATVAQLTTGSIRPNLLLWQPWDIINWRTSLVGGRKALSLVVIAEQYTSNDDGFEAEVDQQFRVLRMTEGVYMVEIWRETAKDEWGIVEAYVPRDGSGKPWEFIPFVFIGSKNNDDTPDLPPLYDLAAVNIAHYRNSADYEEACYMLGQPTPWASGLTEDWVKNVLKGQIVLGSRAIIPLPQGGQVGLLQVQPNTMPMEAMSHKEKQMLALGAKLVEQRDVRQTATEAGMNEASETSILATSANNVSAAYAAALKWAAQFVGADTEGIVFKLNVEFEKRLSSPQDRQQLVAEWQANIITQSEARAALTKIGVATLSLEDFKDEIEASGPDLGVPVKRQELEAADAAAKAKAEAAAKPARSPATVATV